MKCRSLVVLLGRRGLCLRLFAHLLFRIEMLISERRAAYLASSPCMRASTKTTILTFQQSLFIYRMHRMMIGAKKTQVDHSKDLTDHVMSSSSVKDLAENSSIADPCGPPVTSPRNELSEYDDELFLHPEKVSEQTMIDAILDSTIYEEKVRERLRHDPLVRLLIPNPPGKYEFTIVSAMGVVTEGKKGLELIGAFNRLEEQRGVKVIRSDTATARSLEYNASKIEEAIETAVEMGKPYGYIGYSQGEKFALIALRAFVS